MNQKYSFGPSSFFVLLFALYKMSTGAILYSLVVEPGTHHSDLILDELVFASSNYSKLAFTDPSTNKLEIISLSPIHSSGNFSAEAAFWLRKQWSIGVGAGFTSIQQRESKKPELIQDSSPLLKGYRLETQAKYWRPIYSLQTSIGLGIFWQQSNLTPVPLWSRILSQSGVFSTTANFLHQPQVVTGYGIKGLVELWYPFGNGFALKAGSGFRSYFLQGDQSLFGQPLRTRANELFLSLGIGFALGVLGFS